MTIGHQKWCCIIPPTCLQEITLNRNLIILFFTLVVVMLGFGIIIPILPSYIESMGGGGFAMGLLMAIFSAMQFIFSPVWGGLSDRYGRKPILMIGVFGFAITMLLMGLSTKLWMLIATRGLAGMLSSATLPTAMAYIGDSTNKKNRGGGMGVVGAAMGLGMVLGPGIGGILAGVSIEAPFYFAAVLALLSMGLIWLFLPESLLPENRQFGIRLQGPQLKVMWQALLGPLGFLLITAFIISFAMTNFEGIFPYYAQQRYAFDPKQIGLILTVVGLTSSIAQGLLTGIMTRKFGEVNVIKGSLLFSTVGFLMMLAAGNMGGVLVTTAVFILSNAMLRPAVSSLISQRTTQGQGMAMGLNNAFMSLGRVAGPLWAGAMVDVNLSFPYLTGAFIMMIGFISSMFFLKKSESQTHDTATEMVSAD